MECSWKKIKESYIDAAKKVVSYRKKKSKKWISASWAKIEARRKAMEKMFNAKSSRQKNRTIQEYKIKEREMK